MNTTPRMTLITALPLLAPPAAKVIVLSPQHGCPADGRTGDARAGRRETETDTQRAGGRRRADRQADTCYFQGSTERKQT